MLVLTKPTHDLLGQALIVTPGQLRKAVTVLPLEAYEDVALTEADSFGYRHWELAHLLAFSWLPCLPPDADLVCLAWSLGKVLAALPSHVEASLVNNGDFVPRRLALHEHTYPYQHLDRVHLSVQLRQTQYQGISFCLLKDGKRHPKWPRIYLNFHDKWSADWIAAGLALTTLTKDDFPGRD